MFEDVQIFCVGSQTWTSKSLIPPDRQNLGDELKEKQVTILNALKVLKNGDYRLYKITPQTPKETWKTESEEKK